MLLFLTLFLTIVYKFLYKCKHVFYCVKWVVKLIYGSSKIYCKSAFCEMKTGITSKSERRRMF